MRRSGDRGAALARYGWILSACIAALAALPGLWFPYLSDDWFLVESVGKGPLPTSPYDYFRPLYMATFWADRLLWGPSPLFFHLTNLLLIAATAALVVVAVRRYTGDPALAALAGALFALHPYHVENAAWIAVRGDPLYALLLLLAAIAYDRWREALVRPLDVPASPPVRWSGGPVPLASLVLFEAALLAKESAVVFPLFLGLVGLVDRGRRPSRREWVQGLVPIAGVAALHIAVIRPLALSAGARTLTPGLGLGWLKHIYGFCVGALVPVDGEFIAAKPLLWGAVAAAATAVLALLAWLYPRTPGRPQPRALARFAGACAAIFGTLLIPSIVGFQERYLFLPVAALCLALAALVRAMSRRAAAGASLLLAAGWVAGCVLLWSHWYQAALASRSLVGGLVEASRAPGVRRIVVANMPFRIRGGSVAGNFRSALALSGGNPVDVQAVSYINYPDARADFLDGPREESIQRDADFAFVRLRIPERAFCGYVGPGSRRDGVARSPCGKVFFDAGDRVKLRADLSPRDGRAAYAWVGGRLVPLS